MVQLSSGLQSHQLSGQQSKLFHTDLFWSEIRVPQLDIYEVETLDVDVIVIDVFTWCICMEVNIYYSPFLNPHTDKEMDWM